jgi:hypothetical protein
MISFAGIVEPERHKSEGLGKGSPVNAPADSPERKPRCRREMPDVFCLPRIDLR